MSEYPLQGVYINLDRCIARRAHVEAHLDELGLRSRYVRFSGIDAEASGYAEICPANRQVGELGAYQSHLQALKANIGTTRHLHIIEDDVVIAPELQAEITQTLHRLQDHAWDILFTHLGFHIVPENLHRFLSYYAQYQETGRRIFIDVKAIAKFGGMHSYIVNKSSVEKIVRLLTYPDWMRFNVDQWISRLIQQRQLDAVAIVPFLTTVDDELQLDSTIRQEQESQQLMRGVLLNNVMYLHSDPLDLLKKYEKYGGKHPLSKQFLAKAIELSGNRTKSAGETTRPHTKRHGS